MKFSVALNDQLSLSFIKKILKNGVHDFYCGFVPASWFNKFGWEVSLNRRENDRIYHFIDYNQLLYYKKVLDKYKKNLFIAFNSHHHSQAELSEITGILHKLKKLGFNNFIISDLNIYQIINDIFPNPIIRASIGAMNRSMAAIKFYQSLGINQFILPRDLTIDEIIKFLDYGLAQDLLFEVFFISYKCPFSDEICYTSHGYQTENFCQYLLKSKADLITKEGKQELISFYDFYNNKQKGYCYQILKKQIRFCGFCNLEKLKKYNNVVFKIPVRGDESDLAMIMNLIALPDYNVIARTGFCDEHKNCYYYSL